MNINFRKLSLAIALSLGLGATSLAAHAARRPNQAPVMNLGTIQVTAADVEGSAGHGARSKYGSTAYLGVVRVTPADSADSRLAALDAAQHGAVYLGTIQVTANDSEDARYAAALTRSPGTAFLGVINVKPSKFTALFSKSASRFAVLKVIGALAFGRAGG